MRALGHTLTPPSEFELAAAGDHDHIISPHRLVHLMLTR
jgi:hypothetical protein